MVDTLDRCICRPRTRGDLPVWSMSGHQQRRSSPHARGSSRSLRHRGPSWRVVPARAGIFPIGSARAASALGRPRTRGDLPTPPLVLRCPSPSSPHARGSSQTRVESWFHVPVVPARAGIFRTDAVSHQGRRGRPRTRGDLPPSRRRCRPGYPSSPHARGSSLRLPAPERHQRVVPARAGIFPGATRYRASRPSRPRTRGDLPAVRTAL